MSLQACVADFCRRTWIHAAEQLAFGCQPVIEIVTVLSAVPQEESVRQRCDFIVTREPGRIRAKRRVFCRNF